MLNCIQILWLMCAGAFGTLARYLLALVYNKLPFASALSVINGITLVNIVGSFLFALVYGLCLRHAIPHTLQTIFLTGFFGAFTTFSTLIFETRQLFIDNVVIGILYITIQVVIGFLALHYTLVYFKV